VSVDRVTGMEQEWATTVVDIVNAVWWAIQRSFDFVIYGVMHKLYGV
jgi:hypothetical protein